MKEFEAVVFDMDGVIFDSEICVKNIWREVAVSHGAKNFEEHYDKCLGVNIAKAKEIMLESFGADFPFDECQNEVSKLYHERYDGGRLPMKSGIRELLAYLKKNNIKIALASSTRTEVVENQLKDADIFSFFSAVIGGDKVKFSKPHPEIYLKACEELGVNPSEAYAIEDSYNGIRSAHAGNLRPIMVPDLLPPTEEITSLCETVEPNLMSVIEYLNK